MSVCPYISCYTGRRLQGVLTSSLYLGMRVNGKGGGHFPDSRATCPPAAAIYKLLS